MYYLVPLSTIYVPVCFASDANMFPKLDEELIEAFANIEASLYGEDDADLVLTYDDEALEDYDSLEEAVEDGLLVEVSIALKQNVAKALVAV